MNKDNLQKMADYIRTIPQESFDMCYWRDGQSKTAECDSIGCVIGHCTILETEELPRQPKGRIDFELWSERFTGLKFDSDKWEWCFGSNWHYYDNTPDGAALRIEWLINKGLPKNWLEQRIGDAPLCYKEVSNG